MKKSALLLGVLVAMPAFAGDDYGYRYSSSCTDCGYETTRTVRSNSYKKASRKTSGYKNTITNNFYYIQPGAARTDYRAQNYYTPKPDYSNSYQEPVQEETSYTKKSYSSKMRKYFLAHPFFQPEQGQFGSVTDVSYATNSFKFDTIDGTVYNLDEASKSYKGYIYGDSYLSGKAETTQFTVKEDISYGISNNLSLLAMAQYDNTEIKFKDWKDRSDSSWSSDDKTDSDSGINIFGIGLQYRFVDDPEWIAMASGYYQHQKDTANTFVGEIKAGYKVNRTTLYGLGRVGYSVLTDGHIYGTGLKYGQGSWMMLAYKTDVDNVLYIEGGAGAFSVLNKYMTLNGEMIYGHYDWHDQLNIKGAIGFQPGDSFALNFYAMTSLWDSAKDKTLKFLSYEVNPVDFPKLDDGAGTITPLFTDSKLLYTEGTYKLKNYNEWKIGVQAILYF